MISSNLQNDYLENSYNVWNETTANIFVESNTGMISAKRASRSHRNFSELVPKVKLDQDDEADDMRNRKQVTYFSLGLLFRTDDDSTMCLYFDDISRYRSTSARAAICHACATLRTPYAREVFPGIRICGWWV